MYRLGDVFRLVEGEVVLHTFREVFAELCDSFLDAGRYLERIGARQHIDTQNRGILSVDATFRVVGSGFQ